MTTTPRSQRVDRARLDAHLSVQQLWLHYISLSGIADLVEVDAYLHGAFTLDSYQEDKLSYAVNAELDQLHHTARLRYSLSAEAAHVPENPLDVIRELLDADQAATDGGEPSDPTG